MGNHFRTSGAGDDAPKTQTGVQGSRFATPDSEGRPVAQAPAQPADQAQPASDPFAYNPTSDVALSGTAGFEPVQAVTARVEQPQAGAATPQPTMAGIPDPMAPATPVPQPAQSGLFAAIPDPTQQTFLIVELGLQSSNNNTLNFINRGHNSEVFKDAVKKLHERNIFVVAHIINGLPYEVKEDMLNTIKFVNDCGIDGIKIHMLYVAKNTPLASIYEKDKFHILTKEEYIDIVCDQLRLLNQDIVIMRITGDPTLDELIAPDWLIKKFVVLNDIDKEMVKRNIYQGDLL